MVFEKLFESLRIGPVEISNRYGMAPINSIFNDWTGLVSDEDIAFWVARAKGGVGLIIVGSVLVTTLGRRLASHQWIYMTGIEHVPRLALLAENIHLCGAKAFIQILPSTGSRARPISGESPIAPSANVAYGYADEKAHQIADTILTKCLTGRWLRKMRITGQMFNVGITMLIFAIYIGKVQITPQYYPLFLRSIKTAFTFFSVPSFGGVLASFARGKVR